MFTDKELERLNTLVSAEIMKAHLHYGHNHEYTNFLYGIRDKLIKEERRNGERNQILSRTDQEGNG